MIQKKLMVPRTGILGLMLLMLLVSILNFTSIRFSLPIFFAVFAVVLVLILSSLKEKNIDFKLLSGFLLLYFALSVPFLFLSQGYTSQQRFMGFVGSPTIFSGYITSIFVIISSRWKLLSLKFMLYYLVLIVLVYLTKTRLILVLLVIYPALLFLIQQKKIVSRRVVFIFFFAITFLIYPLYNLVINWFPGLVTLRYGKTPDSSFELRNYLFLETEKAYFNGNTWDQLMGKGNEYSRNLVLDLLEIDLMPHNDYMRILLDWGAIGFIIFSMVLFRLAVANNYTLLLCLVYMILFYSNTVFNLFLISLIIILYFGDSGFRNGIGDTKAESTGGT